jgi:hypothetical protein
MLCLGRNELLKQGTIKVKLMLNEPASKIESSEAPVRFEM